MNTETIYDDGTYLSKNPAWHEEDSSWKARQVDKILRKNSIDARTVCEVGCGAGGILECLANDYSTNVLFSGYEISPQAFELCKTKERPNLHFFLGNALDEGEDLFDVVMAIDVLEHVEDYFGFLRKLRARGKYKVLHVPLELSVQTVLRSSPILRVRASVGHIQYFTKETALATLRDTGYEVVDYFYTPSLLELRNTGWKANLLKLPRRLFFSVHQDLAVRTLGGFSLLVLAK